MKSQLAVMDPASPAYAQLQLKFNYYQRIRDILDEAKEATGAVVAKAIADALSVVATDEGGASLKQAKILKQEAINLLKA